MTEKKLYHRNKHPFPLIYVWSNSGIESPDDLNQFGNQRFVFGAEGVQDVNGFHKTLKRNKICAVAKAHCVRLQKLLTQLFKTSNCTYFEFINCLLNTRLL